MPRPTKLTTEAHNKIVGLVRAGNYRETAAAAVGISAKTLRNWLHRAAKGGKANEAYVRFSLELDEAEALAEVLDNKKITAAAEKDWRAAAWRLSRKNPALWGDKQRIEHTGADGGPITTQETGVVMLPPEDPEQGAGAAVGVGVGVALPPEDPANDGAEPEER